MRVADLEPRIIDKPAFAVTGLRFTVNRRRKSEIPGHWQRFMTYYATITDIVEGAAYGLCMQSTDESVTGGFDYMAGVEVSGEGQVVAPLSQVTVAAQRYAVFTHAIQDKDLGKDLARSMTYIFDTWLPASPYVRANAADFECYESDRFDPQTLAGEIDLYIPIQAAP